MQKLNPKKIIHNIKLLFLLAGIMLAFAFAPASRAAGILFQDDAFATVDSGGIIINNLDGHAGNITLQFGKTLNKTLTYNTTSTRFEFNAGVDLGNNQLSTALVENVAAMPGGAGGAPGGASAKGRIVQLTATDSTAPGCTGPSCSAGTYSWDGSTWHPLQGTVTASTATKIVTVGPTGRDYTTISAAATYCNTLSGCEMWVDPGTYPVTGPVNLSNIKIRGTDTSLTIISITGGGKLNVINSKFETLTINVDSGITAAMGLDVTYSASTNSALQFNQINFIIGGSKIGIDSTSGTKPVTIATFNQCTESSGTGNLLNTVASSNLNAGSKMTVINLLTKDPLKISDWPVTIVGGSNVVTTGTITSVPDRTISVSPDMDINNAIQSLISSGGGGVVKLLVGTHNITSPIIVNSNNIAIVGEGPGTIINVPSAGWTGGTGATVAAIQIGAGTGGAPVNNVIVRDLTVQVEPDIHGIKVNGGSENKVLDTVIRSTGTKSLTHTAIVFTDSTAPAAAAGVRLTASRNIVNRDDSITNPGCGTASPGNHCWVDGIHFDGDAALAGQLFGYGNGISDSIISENIVNEVKQTCYAFSKVAASGIFSNRARNIGYNTGAGAPFGLFVNNANDDSVINNTVETNNFTSTVGIELYGNVQNSTFIGNTVNNGSVANYAIAIDFRSGGAASNDNLVSSNEIIGATTGVYVGAGHLRNIVNSNKYTNVTTNVTDFGTYTKLESLHHQDTVNPTVNDDITRDYRTGTMWINTATNATFISTNSSTGAAVWIALAASHTQNTDTGTNATTFILNNGNTATDVTLTFGGTVPQTFKWNNTSLRFDLSGALNVNGTITSTGETVNGNSTVSGSVAIGSVAANTKLDVNGNFALRKLDYPVTANGAQTINDMNIGNYTFIRLTPAGSGNNTVTINGIAGGYDGEVVILYNATTKNMALANENAGSLAANRIQTQTGATLTTTTQGSVMLIYDAGQSRWEAINSTL